MKDHVLKALEGIKAVLPERLTGFAPKFQKFDNVKCGCGWEGHEGQMGRRRTLMGDGTFACSCPQCGVERGIFGSSDAPKATEGFVILPVKPLTSTTP